MKKKRVRSTLKELSQECKLTKEDRIKLIEEITNAFIKYETTAFEIISISLDLILSLYATTAADLSIIKTFVSYYLDSRERAYKEAQKQSAKESVKLGEK